MIQNLAFALKSFTAAMASASNLSPPMSKRTRLKSKSQSLLQSQSETLEIPFRSTKIRKMTVKPPIAGENDPTRSVLNPAYPVKSLSSTDEICTAIDHLRRSDPLLINLLDSCETPKFKSNPPFLALTKSILYQQLATKAAESIYNRFAALCGGEAAVVPGAVLGLSAQQLRVIGVSGRKASYLHDLAGKFVEGILTESSILEMDDETLVRTLTAVKGIGVWSVQMFMIFSLHRPDVLPVGDLGVRKGVQRLYGLKELPKPVEMEKLCDKWKPYRSMGAWYMWRLMELKEIVSKGRDLSGKSETRGGVVL
ncbi:DNA-3-methyladenine glycosylase 1-like [Momordica charantia]|uniref:DNA-3-methyladenine glycosylase 1-like n=1 Tax=Momordica charantia TaxID=3673 RepID=A0A6J1BSP4_MOMCH|nr:DNA-3-methyladenine glycosylase 1-like [Momordica charantia]